MSFQKTIAKKTKIVCTIGPASADYETLTKMAQAGMDVARLNCSHGTDQQRTEQVNMIRRISQELGKSIAILADLQGPKLRLGEIDGILKIHKGEQVQLAVEARTGQLPIQFDLTPYIKAGERMFLNDGLVELIIEDIVGDVIHAEAQNDGEVSSNKGINVPDTDLQGQGFTTKDYEDAEFALSLEVDYLALSYVQTGSDVKIAQELIKKHHSKAKIISKIEKPLAIQNLEEIVQLSDALMVARGDMALETKASLVPIYQQKITRLARQYQKPVIVATQMLESMITNPRPTRAEVSDVGNAVFDQVDAVMLSAESATGKYPVEAVTTLTEVIDSVEQHPDYKNYIKIDWSHLKEDMEVSAIASSAASIAYRIAAKAIIVCTASGHTALSVIAFRPDVPVITITHDAQVRQQMSLVWGTESIVVTATEDFEQFIAKIVQAVQDKNYLSKGDLVVLVTGSTVGLTGATDTIRVLTI